MPSRLIFGFRAGVRSVRFVRSFSEISCTYKWGAAVGGHTQLGHTCIGGKGHLGKWALGHWGLGHNKLGIGHGIIE